MTRMRSAPGEWLGKWGGLTHGAIAKVIATGTVDRQRNYRKHKRNGGTRNEVVDGKLVATLAR